MIERIEKKRKCSYCQDNEGEFRILNKKRFILCPHCINLIYKEIGTMIVPKSPTSILKKDNQIKIERF